MSGIRKLSRLALILSHPYWLSVAAFLGLVITTACSLAARMTGQQLWVSQLVSIGIGVPGILATKYLIRKDIASYAEFSLGIAYRTIGRRSWAAHRGSILAVLPLLASFPLCAVAATLLGLSFTPMLGMLIMLSILGYPEQQEVYLAAKEKLEELENGEL